MEKGFALISRKWSTGDRVTLQLPMPVRFIKANDLVKADSGRVALQRGPIVYCAEWKDYANGKVLNLQADQNDKLKVEFRPDMLSGISVIKGDSLLAIPYYSWANRGQGEMVVWFKEKTRN
jgi:hypothetical protein